jgi:hypothetical protein
MFLKQLKKVNKNRKEEASERTNLHNTNRIKTLTRYQDRHRVIKKVYNAILPVKYITLVLIKRIQLISMLYMALQLYLDFILETDLLKNKPLHKVNQKYSSHRSLKSKRNCKEESLLVKLTKKYFKNGYNFKISKLKSNDD